MLHGYIFSSSKQHLWLPSMQASKCMSPGTCSWHFMEFAPAISVDPEALKVTSNFQKKIGGGWSSNAKFSMVILRVFPYRIVCCCWVWSFFLTPALTGGKCLFVSKISSWLLDSTHEVIMIRFRLNRFMIKGPEFWCVMIQKCFRKMPSNLAPLFWCHLYLITHYKLYNACVYFHMFHPKELYKCPKTSKKKGSFLLLRSRGIDQCLGCSEMGPTSTLNQTFAAIFFRKKTEKLG